jgi:7,8-dihydro-6-hydroxymethylpterin-pyrophosphokinase
MTPPPPAVFVALGTNLGDRERNLARGVAGLAERGLRITARSSVYETEPVGVRENRVHVWRRRRRVARRAAGRRDD